MDRPIFKNLIKEYAGWKDVFQSGSLARKIIVAVLPGVLVTTAFMGAFSYYIARRHILQGLQQEVDTLADQASLRLQTFFQQCRNDLDSLSETPLIRDYMKNVTFGLNQEAEVYRSELSRHFQSFSARTKVYSQIAYVGPNGRVICSTQESGISDFTVKFIEQVHRSTRYENTFRLKEDGLNGLVIRRYAKPVYGEADEFIGVIVLDCDLKHVEDILRNLRVGEFGGTYVEDVQGNLFLGAQPVWESPLTGMAAISGTDWRVGVSAPADEFLDPLKHIRNLTAVLSVLMCLFVLVRIVGRVSVSLEPVQTMAKGTERFASGDLSHRFQEPEAKELKVLASSFNQMAESLEVRTRQLEQRLRQLTALRELDEAVIRRLDEETILRMCLEAVVKGFSFDRAGLYWVDHQKAEIVGRALFGAQGTVLSEESFRNRRIPLDGTDILCEVVRTQSAILVKEPANHPRLNPVFLQETATREFILAPIRGKDRVMGVLAADNYFSGRTLEESDKEGLTLFAHAAGLALENAYLFENLTESEARYRTVLENSPEAIIGLSRKQHINTWSRGAEQILGYTSNEALGKPVTLLFPPDIGKEFSRLLAEVMEKGYVRDYVIQAMAKGGKHLEISLSWGGPYTDFWMNKEWTLVVRDITEVKQLQKKIISSEKLSAVGQLISGIAHELNNPLQVIIGYAEMILDMWGGAAVSAFPPAADSGDGVSRRDLEVLKENAHRCQKIIENLLLFVRQAEIKKKPIDLAKTLYAALDLLNYKLAKKANIQVNVSLSERLPLVSANFQQLQQVFVNLINNAADSMIEKGGEKRLNVRVVVGAEIVRVEIQDTGGGIPEGVRARLFEPFTTTKPEGRGTGLGLTICKQIVEDHKGRLGFASQVGLGTTFWLELPYRSGAPLAAETEEPVFEPVRNKCVLIVDDEQDVLRFLARTLQEDGNTIETASSLEEAASKAALKNYDLVVSDYYLGGKTGFDFFESWSRWSSRPRPPFLFLTGDVLNPALEERFAEMSLVLLHKPINIQSFKRVLAQMSSGQQLKL